MGHDVFCVTQAFFFGARMCRLPVRDENVQIANLRELPLQTSGPWRAHDKAHRCPDIETCCHSTP
eukprot:5685207-Prymnesium_polylepis.1